MANEQPAVFPYNIYSTETVYPRPYYSHEYKGPGTYLVRRDNHPEDAYAPGVFGWDQTPGFGYGENGEGNLVGHSCKCQCGDVPSKYMGTMSKKDACWCKQAPAKLGSDLRPTPTSYGPHRLKSYSRRS